MRTGESQGAGLCIQVSPMGGGGAMRTGESQGAGLCVQVSPRGWGYVYR